jgi:hypothetical protein
MEAQKWWAADEKLKTDSQKPRSREGKCGHSTAVRKRGNPVEANLEVGWAASAAALREGLRAKSTIRTIQSQSREIISGAYDRIARVIPATIVAIRFASHKLSRSIASEFSHNR